MLAYALKPFNSHFYNRVKYIIIVFKDLQDLAPAYLTCFLYHHAVLVLSCSPASYSSFNSSKTKPYCVSYMSVNHHYLFWGMMQHFN